MCGWGQASHCGDRQCDTIFCALMGPMRIPLLGLIAQLSLSLLSLLQVPPGSCDATLPQTQPNLTLHCLQTAVLTPGMPYPTYHFLSVLTIWLPFVAIKLGTRIPRASTGWRKASQHCDY